MSARTGARAKAYGAFYTDTLIADFLVRWAVREPKDTVMDPSFGGGVFLEAAAKRIKSLGGNSSEQVFGVELDSEVYKRVSGELQLVHNVNPDHLIQADFFELEPNHLQLDAVVGNPPFIRYQSFAGKARAKSLKRARDQGVELGKLASSWAAFVIHSAAFIKPGGRLAVVLPAELLHAAYARPLLQFLGDRFGEVAIHTFVEPLFPDLDQETLLLLANEYGHQTQNLTWHKLKRFAEPPCSSKTQNKRLELQPLINGKEKLTHHLISDEARGLYQKLTLDGRVKRLGDVAEVDIGYVTGANHFFHLSPTEAQNWCIPDYFLRQAVLRGRAFTGLAFTSEDWLVRLEYGDSSLLLRIDTDDLPLSLKRYIEEGERQKVHQAYKCRVRARWYALHRQRVPDAFLTSLNGRRPQLVANEANVVAPNTLHLVQLHSGIELSGRTLATLWQTSLTALSAELEGHVLGGGMLKLEPSEAKRILLAPGDIDKQLMSKIDKLLRQNSYSEAQQLVDKVTLQDNLGLSNADCELLRTTYRDLQKLRTHRQRSSRAGRSKK